MSHVPGEFKADGIAQRHINAINFRGIINLSFQRIIKQVHRKKQIDKMKVESTERLFSGAILKVEDVMNEIKGNIDRIVAALVAYSKLPISQKEGEDILNKYIKMLSSFDVTNRCSIDKVIEPWKLMLKSLVSKIQRECKEVAAIYLIGSLGRGEYEEGYSDVNVYVILDAGDKQAQASKENLMISLKIFSKAQFMADSSKKYRIIAKADGLLLFGEDLVKDEKPKAGLFLALTLNEDILSL
jgi:predicted nucleotidyltransferase